VNMRDGYNAIVDAMARGMEPDPNLTVDEWADRFMIVPKETGASEPGPYRTSRTPHARLVMQCLSASHPCKRVGVKGASQMLKTQVALNFLGETVHQRPKNFLWLVPTGKLHKRAAARIDKIVKAVDELRMRFAKPNSRDATNNNDIKAYPGGALYIATAGAAANLAEISVTYVVYDEIDRSQENVGGEGDPKELAETRQTSHERDRKSYYPSSPTIEGESAIDAIFKLGTQRVALAECIHCGHAQPLEFFRLSRSEDGQRALYPCEECGGLHEEGDKSRMFARGLWSDGVPGDGETETFQISAMFLPFGWMPWVALMRQYDKAKQRLEEGSEEAMIAFYNTRLALCWERAKEQTKHDELMNRADSYKVGVVPRGGTILCASVDCQAYRLEVLVMAWGEGMEGWVVDYQIIHEPPSEDIAWQKLDQILKGKYRHESGHMLGITAAFVDSGGKGGTTQDVYNYTATRRRQKIFPVKGASRPNRPIISGKPTRVDINHRGGFQRGAAELWFAGTDTAKDYLLARWKRTKGPGAIHFPADLPESFYKGLVAEYLTFVYKRGRKVRIWEKKKGEANEPLDLTVYNLACAHYLQLHRNTESRWQALRDRLFPIQGDLLAAPETPAANLDTYPNSDEAAPEDRPRVPGAPKAASPRADDDLFAPIGIE
jgi:phage terminase large subunit GpA-like protein